MRSSAVFEHLHLNVCADTQANGRSQRSILGIDAALTQIAGVYHEGTGDRVEKSVVGLFSW